MKTKSILSSWIAAACFAVSLIASSCNSSNESGQSHHDSISTGSDEHLGQDHPGVGTGTGTGGGTGVGASSDMGGGGTGAAGTGGTMNAGQMGSQRDTNAGLNSSGNRPANSGGVSPTPDQARTGNSNR